MAKDKREYVVSGAAAPQDWRLAQGFLDRLGIDMRPVEGSAWADDRFEEVDLNRGKLPYELSDITKSDQYLVSEHFATFWKGYLKRNRQAKPSHKNRTTAMEGTLEAILRFHPRQAGSKPLGEQVTDRLRAEAGLVVVPRLEAGFPRPLRYRAACKRDNLAIQTGGFINFAQGYSELPKEDGLIGVPVAGALFIAAFSDQLEQQLEPAV